MPVVLGLARHSSAFTHQKPHVGVTITRHRTGGRAARHAGVIVNAENRKLYTITPQCISHPMQWLQRHPEAGSTPNPSSGGRAARHAGVDRVRGLQPSYCKAFKSQKLVSRSVYGVVSY